MRTEGRPSVCWKQAIRELIAWHKEQYGEPERKRPLFPSRKFSMALSRSQAHRILERAFHQAGLNGKLATHSLRKTFAQRIYDASGDIFLVQELLGHKSVETTKQYLGVSYLRLQQATQAIELHNRTVFLLHSIKRGSATALSTEKLSTGDLILELQVRGLDVSSIIDQLQEKKSPKEKVIQFPKRA